MFSIENFADDVAMYRSVNSITDCDAFQQDMSLIAVCFSKWQMHLNVSKCDLVCISNKRLPTKSSYYINNCTLQWVLSVEFLGVFVDKLSWSYHLLYTCFC